jgi:hypothetical protein
MTGFGAIVPFWGNVRCPIEVGRRQGREGRLRLGPGEGPAFATIYAAELQVPQGCGRSAQMFGPVTRHAFWHTP